MDITKTYFSLGDLTDPEGWPEAFEAKHYQTGCNQVVRNKDRTKRLEEYRKLAEQGKPTPNDYLEGKMGR